MEYIQRNSDKFTKRITAIRVIKETAGIIGLPCIRINADFYCELLAEKQYFYETDREFIFYLSHFTPLDACIASIDITLEHYMKIENVCCEGKLLDFIQDGKNIRFDAELSRLAGRSITLDTHSMIRKPGITLRMEQNEIGRRAGYYAEKYPAIEITAAYHYMFAMYGILDEMKIPELLSESQTGYMLILGFETYNTVHEDYPPHWHLIYRWPLQCGSQAPHIYIGEDGKMIQLKVSIDCMPNIFQEIPIGSWFSFVDPYGNRILHIMVNPDGTLSCTADYITIYTIGAYSENEGVIVSKDAAEYWKIKVSSDARHGEAEIFFSDARNGNIIEDLSFRFNPLNGEIQ